ncbi:hypothetical protein QBC37DRAFT_478680 [Rhypophila decipiens]|uniref:Uncharacterized protein n=1 Tax=Rhypophila decipiens TaxID=261697 RepID=A0AAN6YHH0_9PEZI|nr:hypothetical protein QBC37DRAFT_478680 [Rhypophila decipiens]
MPIAMRSDCPYLDVIPADLSFLSKIILLLAANGCTHGLWARTGELAFSWLQRLELPILSPQRRACNLGKGWKRRARNRDSAAPVKPHEGTSTVVDFINSTPVLNQAENLKNIPLIPIRTHYRHIGRMGPIGHVVGEKNLHVVQKLEAPRSTCQKSVPSPVGGQLAQEHGLRSTVMQIMNACPKPRRRIDLDMNLGRVCKLCWMEPGSWDRSRCLVNPICAPLVSVELQACPAEPLNLSLLRERSGGEMVSCGPPSMGDTKTEVIELNNLFAPVFFPMVRVVITTLRSRIAKSLCPSSKFVRICMI